MSSKEFWEFIEKENLKMDCENLRKLIKGQEISAEIDDLVCDTIDKLAKEGIIHSYESVDVAYYIANEIKRNFQIQ